MSSRRLIPLLLALALLTASACATAPAGVTETPSPAPSSPAPAPGGGFLSSPIPVPDLDLTPIPAETAPEETEMQLLITAGGQTFTADLADTQAAREFARTLPQTFELRELNGTEKYVYMEQSLPADAACPGEIRAGDLMLYGDDCLVLFYESFSTAYSYTPLGHIGDSAGLAGAVGSGGVTVTTAVL